MTKLSRSKLELFIQCPRCFWLDVKHGVKRPSGPAFALNSAVDHLLKQEFDIHRSKNEQHPLQIEYGIDARPVHHENLNIWRENFKGIQYHHEPTDFLITGAIDDLWINSNNEYIVVDYKATSKNGVVDHLEDTPWHNAYRRQMEIYQWLLRQNGFRVSDTGYFVYCNGHRDREAFDGKLEFDIKLIPYLGDSGWVEGAIMDAKACLEKSSIPDPSRECEFCAYREAAGETFK